MKNFLKSFIVSSVSVYRKSPIKPFRKTLLNIYVKYVQPLMLTNKAVMMERDGIKYRINLNDFMGVEMYYGGGYEPMVSQSIDRFVKPGMTVVDVGANVGLHTCRLAKTVGPEGKVIAFEPDEEIVRELRYNLDLNKFKNVAIESVALSDSNPLDRYVKDKFDFIKIDTDGYEYKIIQSGSELLKKYRPIMVVEFCKFTLQDHGDNLEKLIELLRSLGYSFFLGSNLKREFHKESLLDMYVHSPRAVVNVLCLPQ